MQAAHCAALLAAAVAVQVQMVLAQLSEKTVSWFAAGARYGPEGEGVVVWVTRGGRDPPQASGASCSNWADAPKPGQGGSGPGHF